MAMVKCKECKTDVSTKAEACPSCGAKMPKKTSMFTWLVLILIVAAVYGSLNTGGGSSGSSSTATASSSTSTAERVAELQRERSRWRVSETADKMTGKSQYFAMSGSVQPEESLGFPYSDLKSWIGMGCNGTKEWAFIGFNSAPNLTDDSTESGYNVVNARFKWDSVLSRERFTQTWGDEFLSFSDDVGAISKIAKSNSAMLELNWYGAGAIHFEYKFDGSSKAIAEARAKCRGG